MGALTFLLSHQSVVTIAIVIPDQGTERYVPYPLPSSPKDLGLRECGVHTEGGQIRLFARSKGSSHALVFVHGLNGTWRTWGPLLHVLAERGVADCDVALVDFTGARLPRTMPALDRFSNDINSELARQGWASMTLVAHSTGGSLAAYMASKARRPVEIASLKVISGLYVRLFEAARKPLWKMDRGDKVESTLAKLKLLSSLGPLAGRLVDVASRWSATRKLISDSLYAAGEKVPREVVMAQLNSFENFALLDTLAIGKTYPPGFVYEKISVPVREVIGDMDPLIQPADAVTVAGLIKDFAWSGIEGAGHFAHIERPHATASFLFPSE